MKFHNEVPSDSSLAPTLVSDSIIIFDSSSTQPSNSLRRLKLVIAKLFFNCHRITEASNLTIDAKNQHWKSAAKLTAKGLDARQNKRVGYNHGATLQMKDQSLNNEEEVEELFPWFIRRRENERFGVVFGWE